MARRRVGQCKDIVIGGLRKLLYNDTGNISGNVRLDAARLMMKIDGFYPEDGWDRDSKQADSGQAPAETPLSAADQLLENMRKGEKNATA